ncbi:hypothetical protein [Actinomadura sp. 3N508]|uniref:hypothetical protein n=1 Tax=Actinomadura sp. 3N508 TaxID=3375153 RepID=UPI003790916D
MHPDDVVRELDKVTHALAWTRKHLTSTNEANAALHIADTVLYSPLTQAVTRATESVAKIRAHLETLAEDEPRGDRDACGTVSGDDTAAADPARARSFADMWTDLDRCPHGRHEGDTCTGWTGPGVYQGGCEGGVSLGNPHIQTGSHVGFDYTAQPYVMPERARRHDPEAWRA